MKLFHVSVFEVCSFKSSLTNKSCRVCVLNFGYFKLVLYPLLEKGDTKSLEFEITSALVGRPGIAKNTSLLEQRIPGGYRPLNMVVQVISRIPF